MYPSGITKAILLSVICSCSIATSSLKASLRVSEKEGTSLKKFPVFYRNRIPLGNPLKKIVLGDFNGDRIQDIAGISDNSNRLVLFYGRKKGGLDGEKRYKLQSSPEELQVADIDHNQKDDLLLLYGEQPVLKAFLSIGGKRVVGGAQVKLNDDAKAIRVVTGEKGVDVFTINKNFKVQAYRYQGKRFDRQREPFPKRMFNDVAGGVALTDDITRAYFVCTDPLNKAAYYFQKQISELLEPAKYPLDAEPLCIETHDLNSNRVADAIIGVAANPLSGKAASLKIIYDLGIESSLSSIDLEAGIRPEKIIAKDINGDSFADLVVLDVAEKTVSVYYGKKNGGFYDRILLGAGGEPNDMQVCDLDKDGEAEILLCNKNQNELAVFSVTTPRRGSFRIPVAPEPVALSVSGGQSDPRLVVACSNSKRLMYFGTDEQQRMWGSYQVDTRPDRIWSAGRDGLVYFSSESDKLYLYAFKSSFDLAKKSEVQVPAIEISDGFAWNPLNSSSTVVSLYDRGNKQVQPRLFHYRIDLSPKGTVREVKAGSKISFGKASLFEKVADKKRTGVVLQTSVSEQETDFKTYMFGKLTGSGIAIEEKNIQYPKLSKNTKMLIAGNFDGDSRPDLIVTSPAGCRVLSSGNRYEPLAIKGLEGLSEEDYIASLDIDGDRNMDLLVGKKASATLWAIKGLGNGGFKRPRKMISDADVKDVVITGGDRPMIAVANRKLDTVDLIPVSALKW